MDSRQYKVVIRSQSYNIYKELKKRYEPKLDRYARSIVIDKLDYNDIKVIKRFCAKRHVKYEIFNHNFERGSSYRRTFFNSYKSVNNHYFCAYCGRYVPKEEITVDHIIPVAYAKSNVKRQKMLHKLGINNINDKVNLAPSCRQCNSQKGTKTGLWIYRGLFGKHKWFWYIFHSINFILLNSFIFCLYSYLF